MKSTPWILASLIVLGIPQIAFSQCDGATTIPFATFPLGGFDYGLDLSKIDLSKPADADPSRGINIINELRNGGFNTIWFNGTNADQRTLGGNMPSSLMSLYFGQQNNDFTRKFFGDRSTTTKAVERRFFLASNEMNRIAALKHVAPSVTDHSDLSVIDVDRFAYCRTQANFGLPQLVVSTMDGGGQPYGQYSQTGVGKVSQYEWSGQATSIAGPSDGIILTLTVSYPFQDQFYNTAFTNTTYNKSIFDFIYRLTTGSGNDEGLGSNALYELDYTVYNGTNQLGFGSLPIKYSDWNSYNDATEKYNIKNFPSFPGSIPNKYAVARLSIPIDAASYGGSNSNNTDSHWVTKIVIKVKVLNTHAEIYVRGFRMRSEIMDALEHGAMDHYLVDDFNTAILDYLAQGGCDALNNISSITCGGEMGSEDGFRALAYIDDLFARYTAGNLMIDNTHVRYSPPFGAGVYVVRATGLDADHHSFTISKRVVLR